MLCIVFAFTERPERLGLLSRGQRFPVFPASKLLFPACCLCFPAFHAFHGFWLYGAAWLGALGCLAVDSDFLYSLHPDYYFLLFACVFWLFMLFMVFAFTERPGRLGLLSRGQRSRVFPASRLLFSAFCLCFLAFPGFHDFRLYGAAWAPWTALILRSDLGDLSGTSP